MPGFAFKFLDKYVRCKDFAAMRTCSLYVVRLHSIIFAVHPSSACHMTGLGSPCTSMMKLYSCIQALALHDILFCHLSPLNLIYDLEYRILNILHHISDQMIDMMLVPAT